MKAVIEVDVPEYQIGQEVSVYFKDTMCIKGVCQKDDTIEELEKIKAEILENHKCNSDYNDYSMGMKTQERIDIKIIEKRISELKGETE